MSYKKIRIFILFLLLGIAALFVPVTALQNSIAMAQEYYNEDEENEYYNQEHEENGYYNQEYDPYKKDNNKNAPIVNVEKNLFVCNKLIDIPDNITDDGVRITCENQANFPPGPDSGEYIPCNDEICPFIDESDFGAQIFKDVATVRELSSEGTPIDLEKLHYTVTEDEIGQRIATDNICSAVGFDRFKFSSTLLEDGIEVEADICVHYVGDCEGTIYPGEVKTCTIENYIFVAGFFPPPSEDDNAADNAQSLLQQSNNQVVQSQLHTLRDIISDRTN
jgi:hypothetical protein